MYHRAGQGVKIVSKGDLYHRGRTPDGPGYMAPLFVGYTDAGADAARR